MTANSRCRSCGAPIWWVETLAGKAMPLDPDPVPNGNVVMGVGGKAVVQRVGEPPPDMPLYRSHFVTCPNAAQHRRR